MNATYRTVLSVLTLALFVSACATTPTEPEITPEAQTAPEPESNPEAQPTSQAIPDDDRLTELEARFKSYLESTTLPTTVASAEKLKEHLEIKMAAAKQLDVDYNTAKQDSPPEVSGFLSYRLGQLYLNFACELRAIAAPSDLNPEQTEKYDEFVSEQASYVAQKGIIAFHFAIADDTQPWINLASEVINTTKDSENPSEALIDHCSTLVSHWKAI